jgi:hypothetical protein
MRVHILPPQFVPYMPQMMSQKKPNQRGRSWSSPCFIKQAEHAQYCKNEDQCIRKNAYSHVDPVVPATRVINFGVPSGLSATRTFRSGCPKLPVCW